MKFGHEEVQSLGVVLSLAIAFASLYISITDRLALKENILVTARMSDIGYKTRVKPYAYGYLAFDARFRLLIANNSNRAVSISEIAGGYTYDDGISHGAIVGPLNRVGSATSFEPINLGAWQSQSLEVVVPFPLREECQSTAIPVGKDIDVSTLVNIFSQSGYTFPVCSPIPRSDTASANNDTSKIMPHLRFSGPLFSVSTSTGSVVRSSGSWITETYNYNPGVIKRGR